jgi:hypothetical protein
MTATYVNSTDDILEAMERFGGHFIKQLALLYRLADDTNRSALEGAFRQYFQKYDEFATIRKKD